MTDGDITGYYYWNDWSTIKPSDKPLRIPAFGTSNQSIEMYYIKPYKAGFYYYSPVDRIKVVFNIVSLKKKLAIII